LVKFWPVSPSAPPTRRRQSDLRKQRNALYTLRRGSSPLRGFYGLHHKVGRNVGMRGIGASEVPGYMKDIWDTTLHNGEGLKAR